MDHSTFVAHLDRQATALRAAAVAAGPDAPTGTCPEWTVTDLVRHHANVFGWVLGVLHNAPDVAPPDRPDTPTAWPAVLESWDERKAALLDRLGTIDPDTPCWTFFGAGTASFWSRRMAHEAAIHRLDAEYAKAGSTSAAAVPTLVFDPEFAADGVDELLVMLRGRVPWAERDVTGTALFHAADAGRAWLVRLSAGEPPVIDPEPGASLDADVTVAGTADAVYRSVWGRPSTAIVSGRDTVLAALAAP